MYKILKLAKLSINLMCIIGFVGRKKMVLCTFTIVTVMTLKNVLSL